MKTNELRIGNYVYLNWIDNVRIVTGLLHEKGGLSNDIFLDDYNEIYEDDMSLNPIPLKEEWLVKFGFNPETKHHFVIGNLVVKKINGNFIFDVGLFHNVVLKYVHQLQNLYFALTGEELEIK